MAFPRSRERGPIEAFSVPVTPSFSVTFPRSRERGPIEAGRGLRGGARDRAHFRAHVSAAPLKQLKFQRLELGLRIFPRSRERGPIEAWIYWLPPRTSALYFRAHVSAAPLKP